MPQDAVDVMHKYLVVRPSVPMLCVPTNGNYFIQQLSTVDALNPSAFAKPLLGPWVSTDRAVAAGDGGVKCSYKRGAQHG